jgi:hypothetical protein
MELTAIEYIYTNSQIHIRLKIQIYLMLVVVNMHFEVHQLKYTAPI